MAVIFRAAPSAVTIFPNHPHVEGGVVVELEVQGAPAGQATRAGKRLSAAGQSHAPGHEDLQRSPRGPAAAAICLEPKAAQSAGWEVTKEEARELKPGTGWLRCPHNELR